jgi:hypothetical protein
MTTTVPSLMAAMAATTCGPASVAILPEHERAEMAAVCAACPRTEDCRLWLVTHANGGPSQSPDLCPNGTGFRALAGDERLA